jgi:phosphoglycolate phosphatase-like HAD superfamily hydrolase
MDRSARPLAVVDIDGVVADVRHRLHHLDRQPKDWSAFFAAAPADPPHPEGLAVVRQLADEHELVFLTGRPEQHRRATQRWLEAHGLGAHRLEMRPSGDRRAAAALKVGRLRALAAERRVAVVVDDSEPVLAAAAAAGFPTFAADWEQRDAREEAALRSAQEGEGRS